MIVKILMMKGSSLMNIKGIVKILASMFKRNLFLAILLVAMSFIAMYMVDESLSNYIYESKIINAYVNSFGEEEENINYIESQVSNEDFTEAYRKFLASLGDVEGIKYYGQFNENNFFPAASDSALKAADDEGCIKIYITEKSLLDLGNLHLSEEIKEKIYSSNVDMYPVMVGSSLKDAMPAGTIFQLAEGKTAVVIGALKKGAHWCWKGGINTEQDTLMDDKLLVCVDNYCEFVQDFWPQTIYYVCEPKDSDKVSNQLKMLAKESGYAITLNNVEDASQNWKASYGLTDNKRLAAAIMLMLLAVISMTMVITALCMMRKREYGIMYAAGVSFTDIKKVIVLYNILIVLTGTIAAWLLKNHDINRLYSKNIGWNFYQNVWRVTHNQIIPFILLVCGIVVVLAASALPLYIMKRKNPAQMLQRGD